MADKKSKKTSRNWSGLVSPVVPWTPLGPSTTGGSLNHQMHQNQLHQLQMQNDLDLQQKQDQLRYASDQIKSSLYMSRKITEETAEMGDVLNHGLVLNIGDKLLILSSKGDDIHFDAIGTFCGLGMGDDSYLRVMTPKSILRVPLTWKVMNVTGILTDEIIDQFYSSDQPSRELAKVWIEEKTDLQRFIHLI